MTATYPAKIRSRSKTAAMASSSVAKRMCCTHINMGFSFPFRAAYLQLSDRYSRVEVT